MFASLGYDASGPVAIGLTHWKNPYAQGRPTLPSDLPLFISRDAGFPVYHQTLTRKTELATPLSCPASLSITPVPSYSSSSQETLSQDTTGRNSFCWRFRTPCIQGSRIRLLSKSHRCFCLRGVIGSRNSPLSSPLLIAGLHQKESWMCL